MTVSEYTVVEAGCAVGLQLFGSERPVTGSHEQETPPEPDSGVAPPGPIATAASPDTA